MDKKIEFWFKGFENAIEAIGENSREVFFSECSKNCVKRGALDLYKKLYDRVNGDLDLFSMRLIALKVSEERL